MLLATVGQWAVELVKSSATEARLGLAAVGLAKAAAAVVPVVVAADRMPWPSLWRVICWIGAPILVVYGGANMLVSQWVLAGILRPDGGYDAAAMAGHAYLWDPLFLIWGAALLWWLVLSRRGRQ